MAQFFTGAILLLDIEHVLFPSNKLLVRHVTWSISSTSIGYCCACHEIYTATPSSSIIVENFVPNKTVMGAWARRSGGLKFNGHNSILNVDLTFCDFEFSCLVL